MYSPEERVRIQAEVCKRIALGESVRKICSDEHIPDQTTIYDWLSEDGNFSQQYARAREKQADFYLDQIIEISDDSTLDTDINPESGNEITNHEVIQRSKLRVDTRKWVMAKLAPKKYGDKVETTVKGDPNAPLQVETTVRVVKIPEKKKAEPVVRPIDTPSGD